MHACVGELRVKAASSVLVVNTSFPEINHFAAAMADNGLLSKYVRPYANMGRAWEKLIGNIPLMRGGYDRTFGKRRLPEPLDAQCVVSAGVLLDFLKAVHYRLPLQGGRNLALRKMMMYAIGDEVARVAAKTLAEESLVVANWWCAETVFRKAVARDVKRVLGYSLAHHAFTREFLQEEAELEPTFASTINGHNYTVKQIDQLDAEIELSNHIMVGSSFVRSTFVAAGVPEEKVIVNPYGVDTAVFTPPERKLGDNRFKIIFAGQLGQRKGVSYLLRAYEKFHQTGTDLTMVGEIQGDFIPFEPWKHLFRHIPPVTRHELADLFRRSDVFLFPTLVEGMPLVVLEAMACGLPVITTPNGPGDIVRDGVDGYIVEARDVDAIVDRLDRLYNDPELMAWMGKNAVQRAQSFTWAKYRQRAAQLVDKILTSRNI